MTQANRSRRKRLPHTITPAEFNRLAEQPSRRAPTGIRNRAAMWLMYGSGLRVGEVVALSSRDVNRSAKGGPVIRVRNGKGGHDRVVPLPSPAFLALESWTAIRPRSRWLICTLDGGRISDRYLRAALARYAERAGVLKPTDDNGAVPINPHILRHSFATRLLESGANIEEVRAALGHSNLQTTQVYLHANPVRLGEAIRGAFEEEDAPDADADALEAAVERVLARRPELLRGGVQ